jgi:hypothetical protein
MVDSNGAANNIIESHFNNKHIQQLMMTIYCLSKFYSTKI